MMNNLSGSTSPDTGQEKSILNKTIQKTAFAFVPETSGT